MRKNHAVTIVQILDKIKDSVAPLPSQKEYMKNLATILAMHINRNLLIDDGYAPDDLPVPSAIIVAPTGQGKTFLLRKMVKTLNLNLITVDCSTLVGESYKGVSLSQRLAGAMEEAKDERAFSRSILFFDEVDKLCKTGTTNSTGMTSILQLFNGGSVAISKDDRTAKCIDVSRFTILMGGAFAGLEDIIRQRICPRAKIGFGAGGMEEKTDAECMMAVTSDDLAAYGLMRELLGRIGTILVIPPLNREDYIQLLNAEAGSIRKKYETYFRELYGVHFEMTEAGTKCLAERSMVSSSGARAVFPLVNDLMWSAVAEVEENAEVCRNILDSDGTECCIQYETGERVPETAEPEEGKAEELPWHTIKAKNTDVLIRKLCRYYRNTGGDDNMLAQLEVFLNCAIPYLYGGYRKDDFVFASCVKLAGITKREGSQSPFENTVHRSFWVSRDAYSNYLGMYTPWMSRNLQSALASISVYLMCKHGTNRIAFKILKKRINE